MDEEVSKVMHLLMAVHMQGDEFYFNQIKDIINYYGEDTVLTAENNLYSTRAFDILTR